MIELLAPAGSMEALKTAIASGANAIYLAGKMFGARAYAENFDKEAMEEAVTYAHLHNVKINVTVNTLIDEREFSLLEEYILFLQKIKVDAILVQDLGVANLVRKIAPDIPLHASTQMTVNNLAGVHALAELGFTRVVLAREVSLEDIRHICANTDIEIEIFAHGAICVCYSGQCLMSSMIGGRSGNRGRCAQPCRLPYSLENSKGKVLLKEAGDFLLSPKDMNTLELVPELIKAGVASLKLEGRMKKPEYVAIAVNTYRTKIDNYYNSITDKEGLGRSLREVFNREFTTAYLEKNNGKYMMAADKPNNRGMLIGKVINFNEKNKVVEISFKDKLHKNDVLTIDNNSITVDENMVNNLSANKILKIKFAKYVKRNTEVYRVFNANLMDNVKGFVQKPEDYAKVPLVFNIFAKENECFSLTGIDEDRKVTFTSDFKVVKAIKRVSDEAYFKQQLNRLGGSIYYLSSVKIEMDEGIIVPASVINDLRRKIIEELIKQRLEKYPKAIAGKYVLGESTAPVGDVKTDKTQLVVAVDNEEKLKVAIDNGADVILYGGDTFNHRTISIQEIKKVVASCREYNKLVYLGTPRIMRDKEVNIFIEFLQNINDIDLDGVYAHSLAQMYLIKKYTSLPIWADYSFNIWNSNCIEFLREYGIQGGTLSQELTLAKDKNLVKQNILPLECIVHGRTELMVSEYCVLGSFLGNLHEGKCSMPCVKDKYFLRDRKNELIPIGTDSNCHMHILNSKILNMLCHVPEVVNTKIARIRIDGRSFTKEELESIVRIYSEVLIYGKKHKVFKGQNILSYERNITRGHYFRGVE